MCIKQNRKQLSIGKVLKCNALKVELPFQNHQLLVQLLSHLCVLEVAVVKSVDHQLGREKLIGVFELKKVLIKRL